MKDDIPIPLRWMRSGRLRKTNKARSAPQPEKIPTRPAERVGEGSISKALVPESGLDVTMAPEEIEAVRRGAGWIEAGLPKVRSLRSAMTVGRIAVIMVEIPAAPILNNSLISNNCGNTSRAWTKRLRAMPITA